MRANDFPDPETLPLYLVASDKPQHPEWVPTSQIIKWEDVRAWKIPGGTAPSSYGSGKVIKGSYWLATDGYSPKEIDAASLPKQSLYYKQCGKYEGGSWLKAIKKYDANATLVALQANRVEKFLRDFPHAKEVKEAVREEIRKKVSGLEADHAIAMSMDKDAADQFARLYKVVDKIDDPDLQRTVRLSELSRSERDVFSEIESEVTRWNAGIDKDPEKEPAIEQSRKRYPLLELVEDAYHWRRGTTEAPPADLLLYVNAAYAARKKEAS